MQEAAWYDEITERCPWSTTPCNEHVSNKRGESFYLRARTWTWAPWRVSRSDPAEPQMIQFLLFSLRKVTRVFGRMALKENHYKFRMWLCDFLFFYSRFWKLYRPTTRLTWLWRLTLYALDLLLMIMFCLVTEESDMSYVSDKKTNMISMLSDARN